MLRCLNEFSPLLLSLSLSCISSFLHRFYALELNKRNHLVSSSNVADLRGTTSRPDRELTEKSKRFSLFTVSHDFAAHTKINTAHKGCLQEIRLNYSRIKLESGKNSKPEKSRIFITTNAR